MRAILICTHAKNLIFEKLMIVYKFQDIEVEILYEGTRLYKKKIELNLHINN